MLSALQKDALTESINVAIGQAASLLSELAEEKVELAVPKVDFCDTVNAESIKDILPFSEKGHIVSSSIKFGNKMKGTARLFIPAKESKQLVNIFLNEEYIVDNDFENLTSIDFDAIKEIGNLLLNAVMGGFANLLNIVFTYQPPDVELINMERLSKSLMDYEDIGTLFIIHNNFLLRHKKITGTILVFLKVDSSDFLFEKLNEILSDVL
ncbi:MAG: chemotaxis protein CheC [bacterium]